VGWFASPGEGRVSPGGVASFECVVSTVVLEARDTCSRSAVGVDAVEVDVEWSVEAVAEFERDRAVLSLD
jgi:hypothetical protein